MLRAGHGLPAPGKSIERPSANFCSRISPWSFLRPSISGESLCHQDRQQRTRQKPVAHAWAECSAHGAGDEEV